MKSVYLLILLTGVSSIFAMGKKPKWEREISLQLYGLSGFEYNNGIRSGGDKNLIANEILFRIRNRDQVRFRAGYIQHRASGLTFYEDHNQDMGTYADWKSHSTIYRGVRLGVDQPIGKGKLLPYIGAEVVAGLGIDKDIVTSFHDNVNIGTYTTRTKTRSIGFQPVLGVTYELTNSLRIGYEFSAAVLRNRIKHEVISNSDQTPSFSWSTTYQLAPARMFYLSVVF